MINSFDSETKIYQKLEKFIYKNIDLIENNKPIKIKIKVLCQTQNICLSIDWDFNFCIDFKKNNLENNTNYEIKINFKLKNKWINIFPISDEFPLLTISKYKCFVFNIDIIKYKKI